MASVGVKGLMSGIYTQIYAYINYFSIDLAVSDVVKALQDYQTRQINR